MRGPPTGVNSKQIRRCVISLQSRGITNQPLLKRRKEAEMKVNGRRASIVICVYNEGTIGDGPVHTQPVQA